MGFKIGVQPNGGDRADLIAGHRPYHFHSLFFIHLPLSATDLHSAEHGNFVFSQAIGRNVSETVHSPSSTAELYEA